MTVISAKGPKQPKKPPPLPQNLKRPRAVPTAVVFSRGTRLGPKALVTTPPPWTTPPASWAGSIPEWAVMWSLTVKFRLLEGIDFEYQGKVLGGRARLGGFVPDFVIYVPEVAINVDGLYIHTLNGTETAANDLLVTVILAGRGIPLIHLLDINLLENPIELVRQALAGIQPPGQILT
jgi:very-short-patch-repair endonuclease